MSNSPQRSPLEGTRGAAGEGAVHSRGQKSVLGISTAAFTLLFAVWLMFGVLAIPISKELKLSDVQFSWLTAIAILNGSIWRLGFGILADRFGGRRMMTLLLAGTAVPTALVGFAHGFGALLLLAFLVGMAGNGFAIGVAWNSVWFKKQAQGFALGVFGAGNVGASVTKLIGPAAIVLVPAAGFAGGAIPGGWRFIPVLYAALLLLMAVFTWAFTPADRLPARRRTLAQALVPLRLMRVWRFGFYYVLMFGAYVALSVWLPHYYQDVYHLSLPLAAGLTALFIFPASLMRPLGGYLSDRWGARRVMYGVFALMGVVGLILAIPSGLVTLDGIGGTTRVFHLGTGAGEFTVLIFLLGVGMGLGKAAVYKYIPEYFPNDVGAVGGLVGALGGLGGFFLPPLFAWCQRATGMPQATFAVLWGITLISFLWLHVTVLGMKRSVRRGLSAAVSQSPAMLTASVQA